MVEIGESHIDRDGKHHLSDVIHRAIDSSGPAMAWWPGTMDNVSPM